MTLLITDYDVDYNDCDHFVWSTVTTQPQSRNYWSGNGL